MQWPTKDMKRGRGVEYSVNMYGLNSSGLVRETILHFAARIKSFVMEKSWIHL